MSDFINRIESVIREKGLTFTRVERDCGLGNGTIKRWSEQSPRPDKLVVVAEYLDVSLDYLVFGSLRSESSPNREKRPDLEALKQEQGLTCDAVPLSQIETDLVAMYRLLPPSHQEELFELTHFKYVHFVEMKKGSIFSTYTDEEKGLKKTANDRDDRSALA